jgi:hypothetical protein
MSIGDPAEKEEDASDWYARTPMSPALATTRGVRRVERVRRAAVRAGSL